MRRWRQINAISAAATAALVIVTASGCAVPPTAEPSASPIPTSSLPAATAGDKGDLAASTATPSPSTTSLSPPPTPPSTAPPERTPEATPLTSLTPGPLRVDGLARVVADRLRVRSAPGTGAASMILGEPLTEGREVFVVAGPVPSNGYLWWQVLAVRPGATGPVPFGWIAAAGRDGEMWLAPAAVACPTDPSIADLARFGGAGALVCYRGRELQVRAFRREACGDGMTNVIKSRGWIAWVFGGDRLLDREADWIDETTNGIYGRAHPTLLDSGTPYFGCGQEGTGWFDVTGHFDDPVSSDCRAIVFDIDPTGGEREVEPALSITECRQTFVYTELRPAPGP